MRTCDRRLTLNAHLIAQHYSRSEPGAENNEDMHFAASPPNTRAGQEDSCKTGNVRYGGTSKTQN